MRPNLPLRRSGAAAPIRSRLSLALAFCALSLVGLVCHEPAGFQTFSSPQADPIALSPDGSRLYVAATTANQLQVIDTATNTLIAQIQVGMEPVSVAVRPDGNEVWVANHVSDSVSVVDTNSASPTLHHVIETIQDLDAEGVTLFDEPVGIAFASNAKAYVALSSRDQIAIIESYSVTNSLDINAQDPRALRVRNGRLYVLPFESGNQTELATCPQQVFTIDPTPGSQCTFDQADHNFATNPQLVGAVVDLVVDPDVPDRDLYVYNTTNDTQVEVVSGVGTLLYGLAVSSTGEVFVSMTEARNAVNGQAGTSGQGLADLQNRMFLNQLAKVDCSGASCGVPAAIDLEEAPGTAVTTPLATPYGIAISNDDSTLVVTAASSSRIFSFDATATGMAGVLDTLDVGAIPKGVALRSDVEGAPQTAYVLNTLGNSVSVVDVSNPASLSISATVSLPDDPTPEAIRLGRIAFNDAAASTSGTFSCESCHPDAHTDQLLWIIGAECNFAGCDQEELRSTMPIRGLRDTLPLHWDGVLGDPFGGSNGEIKSGIFSSETEPPNCGPNGGGGDCFRHLVDAAISGVMCETTSCPTTINELGLPGGLLETERDNMAVFMENVSYPPARSRRPDDTLTAQASTGFENFFFDQGGGGGIGPQTCADATGGCHALPWTNGTSSPFVLGFDAPTMRGITDRWLQFSVGVTNVEEQLTLTQTVDLIDPPAWTPALGFDELTNWKLAFGSATSPGAFRDIYNVGPFEIFQMIEEMSTGYAGTQGRQVTLNPRTTGAEELAATEAILDDLEAADLEGLVNLRGFGLRSGAAVPIAFGSLAGIYEVDGSELSRAQLLAEAQAGTTLVTLTADLRANVGQPGFEPPAISVPSVGGAFFNGRLDLPVLPGDNPMSIRGVAIRVDHLILVDGALVSGRIACTTGSFSPQCPADLVSPTQRNLEVTLDTVPPTGTHFLQLQTRAGLLSNELPFTVQ